MKREVTFKLDGEVLRCALPDEIDHHAARGVRERIDCELFRLRPRELELDFSSVGFMDSSGVGLIIGRAELCRELGCRVKLSGLSSRDLRLLRLSGIEKIDNIFIS